MFKPKLAARTIFDTPVITPIMRFLSYWICKMHRWKVARKIDLENRCVLIGVPHTSNWDLLAFLATALLHQSKVYWLGKKSLFRSPYGWALRWLGGISVNRSMRSKTVEFCAELFQQRKDFVLLIAPEGTRQAVNEWKSGFYYIAQRAGVPIGLAYINRLRRESGVGEMFYPSGNYQLDLNSIQQRYEYYLYSTQVESSCEPV